MSKFPVEYTDEEGVVSAVNYLLSGPSGTGQNFSGFSTDAAGYLTGNYRLPYTSSTSSRLSVNPIALGTSEMLDGRTWKFTYATPQSTPPFALGNNVEVTGVTPSDYDGFYSPIGVIETTTTYCVCRTTNSYTIVGPGSGGTISKTIVTDDINQWYSTDCNSRVTVTGGTDRVFISAQINNTYTFSKQSTGNFQYSVAINRYIGTPNNDPTNPDYVFNPDKTVAEQTYDYLIDATVNQAETFTITSGTAASNALQTTYFIPNATTTSGTGSGVNLNITIAANTVGFYSTANTLIEVAGQDGGENYTVGDVITIDGAALGGTSGVNDLVITVATTNSFARDYSQETIFTTVIDNPPPGYYWYILELQWFVPDSTPTDLTVGASELGFRNLTAQLIKA